MKEIIKDNEMYIQDIIQGAVFNSDDRVSDIDIYNSIVDQLNITSIDAVARILYLIRLNRHAKLIN
jgi:hypothetical protein